MAEGGVPVGYQPESDVPPARPASVAELPFKAKRQVRWYSPAILAEAGMQVIMASAFGNYLDKRELQSVLEQKPFDLSCRSELWIDYVADTGDGFDATYTVASLVASRELELDGLAAPLPRAELLVLGGDQVYPDATAGGYKDRFEGPFEAALPWTPPHLRPTLFAVPGNHDWYDGLTSFLRVFAQQKAIGGWQTYQTRSYFAVKLAHGWWLWGIDIHTDAYIDEPQLRFFAGLDVQEGERIILCTAEPTWAKAPADPDSYRNLGYLERKVIAPKGAKVVLTLAGDLHHYARYAGPDGVAQKITAGGGGAFLHPTHGLPRQTSVRSDPEDPDTETTHRLTVCYPKRSRSRLLAVGTLALPLRNPSFVPVPGVLHLLATAEVLRGLKARVQRTGAFEGAAPNAGAQLGDLLSGVSLGETFALVFASPISLGVLILVLLALVGFAKPPRQTRPRWVPWAKRGMGLVHTGLHVVAVALIAWPTLAVASFAAPGWPVTATVYVLAFVLGGVVGSLVFGLYLTVVNTIWGAEDNHAFSAQRRSGYKNFLRLRLRPDGVLDVYAIGIERTCRQWKATSEAANDDDAWLVPATDCPSPHLIEHFSADRPPR